MQKKKTKSQRKKKQISHQLTALNEPQINERIYNPENGQNNQFLNHHQKLQQIQFDNYKQSFPQIDTSIECQSFTYVQDSRKRYVQQANDYLKLVIVKAIIFGFLIAVVFLIIMYDKIFFQNHYYQRTEEYLSGHFGLTYEQLDVPHTQIKNTNNIIRGQPDFDAYFEINKANSNSKTLSSNFPFFGWNNDNPNSYHEINDDQIEDKYILQGYIMTDMIQKQVIKKKLSDYTFAAHLLQVVHNVNFKGQIVVQKSQFQSTQDDLLLKKRRITAVLEYQKQRYQDRYHISRYIQNQLPFCVIVPSYNNVKSRLYLRNLDSIFMQDYQNYHVVYIDDASPDKTGEFVSSYIQEKQIPKDKIQVIINKDNVLALANIYNGITNYCKSGQIVMLLDGDDSFMGRQVMSLFNAVYQQNKAGLVYSRYGLISTNSRLGIGGSSRQIPPKALKQDKFRQLKGFYTSHLLSFYADLFWKVKKQDLTYENGTFFKFAYDVALVTPIIQMINPKIVYIPQTTYEYRYDTGLNDPGWGQVQVDNLIYAKEPYKRLTQFPFIEKFYEDLQTDKSKKSAIEQKDSKENEKIQIQKQNQ